jgi:hypothetical protein
VGGIFIAKFFARVLAIGRIAGIDQTAGTGGIAGVWVAKIGTLEWAATRPFEVYNTLDLGHSDTQRDTYDARNQHHERAILPTC